MKKVVFLFPFLFYSFFIACATTIYVYVDEDGIRHFTNIKPVNKNYEVLIYGEEEKRVGKEQTLYDGLIWRLSSKEKIDPHLVKAIIKVESNFNPKAVSRKGAMGLMQLMPETIRLVNVKNPFDPEENIKGGISYLKRLFEVFEDNLELVLAAYNAGPSKVFEKGYIPSYKETEDYIKRVRAYYSIYKNRNN